MTHSPPQPHPERPTGYRPAPFWAAVLYALFTLPLLYVGGSVTTYGVGMAVPDWPTTFGANMFLYNFWNAAFGVRLEHQHRLYGSAVGFATILLCLWFLRFEPRRWMKGVVFGALVVVIVQGILGGTRVTRVSTPLAALHGCLGQGFFALTVAMAIFTGRDWLAGAVPTPDARGIRRLSVVVLALIVAQIALGAVVRHFSGRHAAIFHGVVGVAILGAAAHVFVRIKKNDPAKPSLRTAARILEVLAVIQILLGFGSFAALWPFDGVPRAVGFYQAVVRTLHQTNGAVLLAASVATVLRAYRHLGPCPTPAPSPSPSSQPVDLEVVA